MRAALFFILCAIVPALQAEIYKWVDADGKTHFGDRPPEHADAEDISSQSGRINVTSNYSSPEMMLKAEQQREQEYQQAREEYKRQQAQQPSQSEVCRRAQRDLFTISGPVVFYDEDGKPMNVSEKERARRAKELNDFIQKTCR